MSCDKVMIVRTAAVNTDAVLSLVTYAFRYLFKEGRCDVPFCITIDNRMEWSCSLHLNRRQSLLNLDISRRSLLCFQQSRSPPHPGDQDVS